MYDLDVLLKSYFGFSSLVQLEEMCLCDTSVAEPVMKTLHLRLGAAGVMVLRFLVSFLFSICY